MSEVSAVEKATPSSREMQVRGSMGARSLRTKRRSSFPDDTSVRGAIGGLFEDYAGLAYMLPWEVLDYVELLAIYNPDYSQAVDNIQTLANSGHELFVSTPMGTDAQPLKDRLEEKARGIQERHGGIDGLIDKLLHQAATYGAMCGEWIINEELDDVVDFADINPKSIRFFWDEDQQAWMPYQKVSAEQAKEAEKNGQRVKGNNCVELNPITFRYYAFNAAPASPYGVPPFIAALGNIAIQRDMVHNMAQIVKKVGLLGIIDMTIESLRPEPGESEEQFAARAGQYLDQYASVIEEMVRDGGIVHFDDVEVDTTNISGNAAGATNIFKQNEEQVFSGLKSMPSVQGRSYSTTETYAGVAYDIIIRNTVKYQRACRRMIESGYWLMVALWGARAQKISMNFNKNKTLHRLHEAQAERFEIGNALFKWELGILDQEEVAQSLGHSSGVALPMDRPPQELTSRDIEIQQHYERMGTLVEELVSRD